jgi:hypothetical protein
MVVIPTLYDCLARPGKRLNVTSPSGRPKAVAAFKLDCRRKPATSFSTSEFFWSATQNGILPDTSRNRTNALASQNAADKSRRRSRHISFSISRTTKMSL